MIKPSAIRSTKAGRFPTKDDAHPNMIPRVRRICHQSPPWSHHQAQHRGWASASRSSPKPTRLKTALFFPGQGVQRVGMANPWLSAFPQTCKPFLAEVDDLLSCNLSRTIAEGPSSALTSTENAQPAIMATSIMVLRVLEQEFGFKINEKIDVCLGHSLGEFAALVASGHMSYVDSLKMVRRRAEVMARCSREASKSNEGAKYGMIALVCEPDHLSDMIDTIHDFLSHGAPSTKDDSAFHTPPIEEVSLANVNSKNQIVLSGVMERIETLLVQLKQFSGHDPRAVRLNTDTPFHSPFMAPAVTTMRDILSRTKITFPGAFPCVSNVSARPFESEADLKDLLARECVETVRWWDSIKFLDQQWGVRRWIGLGPGKVGRNLVGKEVGIRGREGVEGGGVWGVTEPREVEAALKGLEETEFVDEEADAG